MKRVGIALIHLYQRRLRSFHSRQCIYTPTCSQYGVLAIEKYGLLKGAYYTYLRIRRCNGALFEGGMDHP